MKKNEIVAKLLAVAPMHQSIAESVPQIRRGVVWCCKCGREEKVDGAACLCNGWPKCCGQTMTIDSPEEPAAIEGTPAIRGG